MLSLIKGLFCVMSIINVYKIISGFGWNCNPTNSRKLALFDYEFVSLNKLLTEEFSRMLFHFSSVPYSKSIFKLNLNCKII